MEVIEIIQKHSILVKNYFLLKEKFEEVRPFLTKKQILWSENRINILYRTISEELKEIENMVITGQN